MPTSFLSVMHYLRTQACIQNETICMEINWPYENMLSITDGTLNKYPVSIITSNIFGIKFSQFL